MSIDRYLARRAEIHRRLPALSCRVVNTLDRHFRDAGLTAILAATDEELLRARNFGHGMLAEFRAVWPHATETIPEDNPWREHAEMVAGV